MSRRRQAVVATITAPSREVAEAVARRLVERQLAACVQIVDPVLSVYRWQGRVEEAKEILLILKTAQDLLPQISLVLKELHPYELPELLATPVVSGSPEYLRWLLENLQ